MYHQGQNQNQQWQFVPVPGQKSTFQIISTSSHQAMAMNKVDGQKELQVSLEQPQQNNQKQHWQIEEVQTGEPLQHSPSRNNQQNNQNSNESDY